MFDIDGNLTYSFADQDIPVAQTTNSSSSYEETKKELDQVVWFDPIEKEYFHD